MKHRKEKSFSQTGWHRLFPWRRIEPDVSNSSYEKRVEKLQRRGDGAYLQIYWDAYSAIRFAEACAAIAAVVHPRRSVRLLDFGCGAGALLRAVNTYLAPSLKCDLIGVDPDQRALAFVSEHIPDAVMIEADPIRLREMSLPPVDICTSTSALLGVGDDDVKIAFEEFARLASAVIVGDQIENLDGERAVQTTLTDVSGKQYETYCHPFRRLLRSSA